MTTTLSYSDNFLSADRQWDNNNIAISLSFLDRSSSLLPPPFPPSLYSLPDRRSFHLYFGTLATLTRVSMTTISAGRRTNRVLFAPPISRFISLFFPPPLLPFSLSLFLFVPSRSSPSFLFAISFFHPVPSIGPPVRCNYDVRGEREEKAATSRLH